MKDPQRLLHDGATEFERFLMSSAANERPPTELGARMQAGLATIGSRAAGSAGSWAISWTRIGALTVVIGGLATLGGMTLLGRDVPALRSRGESALVVAAPVAVATPVEAPSPQIAAPAEMPPTPNAPAPTPSPNAPAFAPAPNMVAPVADSPARTDSKPRVSRNAMPAEAPSASDELHEETLLMLRARSELLDHNLSRVFASLREYAARFPHGALAPEATVLRVQALDLDGQHAQAVTLGRRFLVAHSDSPLADRVERIVGGPAAR
jgi:hypothetical protein